MQEKAIAKDIDVGAVEFQTLHEIVALARRNLDQNAWDYIVGGAETETTLRRNRLALDALAFRPRVLRDVSRVEAGVERLGRRLRLPLLLAPPLWMMRFGTFWSAGTLFLLRFCVGLDHDVTGRENLPAGPVLIAMKHQSAWDTFAAPLLFRNPAMIIKRELAFIPFYGWYAVKAGMITVDRSGGAQALEHTHRTDASQPGGLCPRRRLGQGAPVRQVQHQDAQHPLRTLDISGAPHRAAQPRLLFPSLRKKPSQDFPVLKLVLPHGSVHGRNGILIGHGMQLLG